jgi:opacity protein-like surface antigen
MSWKIKAILTVVSCLATTTAMAADAAAPVQFDSIGGVKSWKAGGDAVVFIKNRADQWYKAELDEACMKYDTSKGVKFLTELDPVTNIKVSKVLVERRICKVVSLAKVDSPDTAK